MPIHLITVVGGNVTVLRQMLSHYIGLGIDTFTIHAHGTTSTDPVLDEIESVSLSHGVRIASRTIGPWSQCINPQLYRASMQRYPNDWFVIADQDEFQVYPDDLRSLGGYCNRKGYDYLQGALIDRFDQLGELTAVGPSMNIWQQFPVGACFTPVVLGGDPSKVVFSKGHVQLGPGQHHARTGRAAPLEVCSIPVHHFKWVEGVISQLRSRSNLYQALQEPHWQESARFVEYYAIHHRIDLSDPAIFAAHCNPSYPYWNMLLSLRHSRAERENAQTALRRV